MENIIIIGSGPAGMTAAIYAARANLSPVVITGMSPGGQLVQTSDVENFPGFEEPIAGTVLVETMRKQAERLGVRVLMDEVTSCNLSGDVKKLSLMMEGDIESSTVIIATGASARYLGMDSEQALIGKGVSGCATCDGAFYKGQDVAVIGGGDTAMEDALYLSRIVRKVTVIHRRDEFRASRIMGQRVIDAKNIDIMWDSVPEDFLDVEKGEVTALKVKNVKSGEITELPVQGVFIAIGHTPNTALFADYVDLDEDGYIKTENTRTSVEGVFAAGDVQDRHYKQAVTAAGTGCMAALEAERWLGTQG
ncbi:MAG: thioredoxin-disulfide reductase [Kiritimatiellae bacterium]|jgi:thioredoxin reductase (NADPH)|nr:thioredoxin-disulfide reductase [Kiritimatiellia bacterium]